MHILQIVLLYHTDITLFQHSHKFLHVIVNVLDMLNLKHISMRADDQTQIGQRNVTETYVFIT